ncbi:MAG: AEC family transporter [Acidimicrobiales bacterium]
MSVSLLVANAGRLGVLAVPVALGVLVARLRLIGNVVAAIDALNVYTLYVGFPALIAAGVVNVAGSVTGSWGFWAIVPVVDVVLVVASRALGAAMAGRQAGSMALVCLFGNTAYLGIPFVVSVLGEAARGPAAVLVAVQVTLAVAVGPVLLVRWSGTGSAGVDWGRVLRQPLLWAPLVGLAARALPAGGRGAVLDVLSPLAASTAPIAMFLLGLYLFVNAERMRTAEAGVWAHVAVRLVAAPLVSIGIAVALRRWGGLDASVVPIVVLLGGMPAAITTFSLARHAGVATERVASVVVRSSVASVLTLPILATIAERVGRW